MKSKSWAKQESPVYHSRNDKKFGITVFGALGKCLKSGMSVMRAKSTNKVDYKVFLRQIKEAVKEQYFNVKPILLYDGHPAHIGKDVVQMMSNFFTPIQIPGYSCEFNCKYSSIRIYFVRVVLPPPPTP